MDRAASLGRHARRRRAYRRAGSAVCVEGRIDEIDRVPFRDALFGTFRKACRAGDALFGDPVRHSSSFCPLDYTDSTRSTEGISLFSSASIPFFSVTLAMGQPPHAPVRRTFTTPPSTSTSSTSPPSACRAGRILPRTFSTSVLIPQHLLPLVNACLS